jgi:geranylgeranyl diphosphate synthase type I
VFYIRERRMEVEYFVQRKQEIQNYLGNLFQAKQEEYDKINPLGRDLCRRLYAFSSGGKMIRGGLVALGYSLFKGEPENEEELRKVIQAGAAMELFQSALLVHDDIMDKDVTRRGLTSIFYQYAQMAKDSKEPEFYHLGESLGICAGDVAFFLGFEILAELDIPPHVYRNILTLVAKEISYVGVAQMQDVVHGGSEKNISNEAIMKLYLYKTGRYTFSLPLMVGALLAEQEQEAVGSLEKLGEYMGVAFQIRDDELGLFGDPEETGKPVGSDIQEGKKTLYYEYLFELADESDRKTLQSIFGSESVGQAELTYVRSLAEQLGIPAMVGGIINEWSDKARDQLQSMENTNIRFQELLSDLLEYTVARTK